jgi:hypothetical protein
MHVATVMDLKEVRCEIADWIKLEQDMFVITTHLQFVKGNNLIKQLRDYQLIKNSPDPWR